MYQEYQHVKDQEQPTTMTVRTKHKLSHTNSSINHFPCTRFYNDQL